MASEQGIAPQPEVGGPLPQAADAERPARPAATVIAAPPGEQPDTFTPGDFSLYRATTTKGRGGATTVLGKLIQAGERRRFGNCDFARWTHSALIVFDTGDIVEAIESGIKRNNISKYRDSDYVVPDRGQDLVHRRQLVFVLRSVEGLRVQLLVGDIQGVRGHWLVDSAGGIWERPADWAGAHRCTRSRCAPWAAACSLLRIVLSIDRSMR
jgi:hypothetical protein